MTTKERSKITEHNKNSENVTRKMRPSKEEQIEQMRNFFNPETFPKEFGKWTEEEQNAFIDQKLLKYKEVPKFVVNMYSGIMRPLRTGSLPSEIPEWADAEKAARGKQFVLKHFLNVSLSVLVGHFIVFSFREMRQPIDITRNSFTPYKTFLRFLNTMRAVRKMAESDLLKKGSPGYAAAEHSRKMHGVINKICDRKTVAELNEISHIKKPWSLSIDVLLKDFREAVPELEVDHRCYAFDYDEPWRQKSISQTAMSMSLIGLVGIFIDKPKFVGVHNATEQDIDDLCHWARLFSYHLGIDDKYNTFGGTVPEIREAIHITMEMFAKPNLRELDDIWEHMVRCLSTAASYYVPFISFESYLLFATDYLNIPMKKFRASIGFLERVRYRILRFLIDHLMKWRLVSRIANKVFDYFMDKTLVYGPEKLAALEAHSNKMLAAASVIL